MPTLQQNFTAGKLRRDWGQILLQASLQTAICGTLIVPLLL